MPWLRSLPLLLLLAPPALAADWPQWLGPRRDGSSAEKVKPWKGDLKVLWRKPVGPGHSSPVVAGGKVYLHTQVPDKDEEQLTAYDTREGNVLWKKSYPRGKFSSIFGTGPQATPAVAGGRVYYCDPAYQETGARLSETYLRRLKGLADSHGVPWRYAPLHHFLTHPEDSATDWAPAPRARPPSFRASPVGAKYHSPRHRRGDR